MREFAESEITLPSGPFEGRRFRADRQPFSRLWLNEVDSGRWSEVVTTGPQQCGKSLLGFVVPICHHLFEIGETIVVGVPSLDGVSDKWNEDILPVIERTRYRELLPLKGGGSRGGRVTAVRFRNGATLRWMTAGGSDKTRASFTARVLIVTETDGFDVASETSREATKLHQLEGRTRAYGARRLIYKECTVTTKEGHTWSRWEAGSQSRIMTPCPHCRQFVSMERENLIGWQDAETEDAARRNSGWFCPACGQQITDDERVESNQRSVLVHRGQEIDEYGTVHGPIPPTRTLGFRWSAYHNLFTDAAELGAEEWKAKNSSDEENAEKALRQFVWCLPHEPNLVDDAKIDPKAVMKRQEKLSHREIPADTTHLTLGVDIGKWTSWYLMLAFRADGRIHIPDYGVIEVHSDQFQEEVAILAALREFRLAVESGWPIQASGDVRRPDAVWIDAGHLPKVIHQFATESGTWPDGRYLAVIGRGASQVQKQVYRAPARTTNDVRRIGDRFFISRAREYRSFQGTFDADHWKLWVQAGLRTPQDQRGGVTLFDAGPDRLMRDRHNKLSRHFASEQLEQRMEPGKGLIREWVKHGANHWLDCAAIASAAGSYCGFRLTQEEQPKPEAMDANQWFQRA